jgi:peptidyl-prolyl cis-trans isomerase D
MLSFFRRGVMAKIMLAVLFISLVAIVITGFGTGGGGLGDLGGLRAGAAATVGGERLTSDEVKDAAQRQFERIRQQQPELDMASFLRGGTLGEVVEQMIDVLASKVFGRDQGLGVSRKMVDSEIAGVEAFQDVTGKFDESAFRRILAQERLSEKQLRDDLETRLIQRQLLLPAAGSAFVPNGLAFQYASLLLESRTGTVGAVPTQAMGVGAEPTDAELAAFYRSNQARYTIPERRVIRYAVFGPENVAGQAQAGEAEIQAAYNQNAAYKARETRSISRVVMPSQQAAQAFAAKLAGGKSFAAAATEAGFSPADTALPNQTRQDLAGKTSPAVANAVFGSSQGANIGPVQSPFGWIVARLDSINVTAARPLAAVRAEIAAQIQQRKTQDALNDLASRLERAIGEGSSFEEIARQQKLAVRETPPVTAAGASPENAAWQAPPEVRPLLEGAFALEPGEDPAVETIQENQRYALVAVPRAIPAAPPSLTQIRERVKADLIVRRASERARAVATSIVAKINAGVPPAQAFAQAQVKLPPTQTITATRRDLAKGGAQVPPPMAMMFSLPRGKARILAAPDGRGWFIVYLEKVVPGNAAKEPQLMDSVRGQFAQIVGDEYARQFTRAMRKGLDVRRNEEAIRKLRGELTGSSGSQ